MKFFNKVFSAALALSVIFFTGSTTAQITKKAQVGVRFLENPVSAEVVGRGSVGVTTTFNSNGIFWNPALLGYVESNFDVNLNHTSGIADIDYNAAAASVRLGNFGVLGISFMAMDYGTFYQTRRANNEAGYVESGTFSPSAFTAGIAFSQKVTDRFSYGIHIKYFYQDLGKAWIATNGTSVGDPNLTIEQKRYSSENFSLPLALDVGAVYDFKYNGIRFGASLQNISREFTYENQAFPLPFAVNFGATVEPLGFFNMDNSIHKLVVSAESRHPRDFGEKAKFGAEYSYMDTFFARGGYMTGYDDRGFSIGAGIKYAVSGIPLRVDYAYQPDEVFGGIHFITIGFSY